MSSKDPIAAELTQEAKSTRKMLERIPAESFGWKPHVKSKSLGELAYHLAGLTNWLPRIVNSDEFDLSTANFQVKVPATSEELIGYFEESLSKAEEAIGAATDEALMTKWKLRSGEHVIFELPRTNAIRSMVLNHIVHHRAQISVYLRLLDVPVPGMYGPTADEGF